MSRFRAVVCATALAAGVLVVSQAGVAAADPKHPLPLGLFNIVRNTVVVDHAHAQVFISGATSPYNAKKGGLVVTAPDGSDARRVSGVADARGLALSADGSLLYVARDGAILAVDVTTLAVVDHISTAAIDGQGQPSSSRCPWDLAVAGGNLWFSYGCGSGDGGIGVLDLLSHDVTPDRYDAVNQVASLAAAPGTPDRLVVAGGGAGLAVLTVAGTGASVDRRHASADALDAALTPDGATLVAAQRSRAVVYDPDDLSVVRVLRTGDPYGLDAVAVSNDGEFVATVRDTYTQDIEVHRVSTGARVRTYSYNRPHTDQGVPDHPQAVAWNGKRLISIRTDYLGDVPTFTRLSDAALAPTKLTLAGPHTARRAANVHIQGSVRSANEALSHVRLAVTRTDRHGQHKLPALRTSASGSFVVHDAPGVGGTNAYAITFGGDAVHAPTTQRIKVTVERKAPALSLAIDRKTYDFEQRASVTVHLGTTHDVRAVSVYLHEHGAHKHLLRTARVDHHGMLHVRTPKLSHSFSISARFAGDDRYEPRTITVERAVRVHIRSAIAGDYGRSGKYRLFHQSKGGGIAIKVAPSKAGKAARFRLEIYRDGAWRPADSSRAYLNSNSVIGVAFDGQTYTPFRVRGEYHGDRSNAGSVGRWYYVQFR